jgi:hypothetical protein
VTGGLAGRTVQDTARIKVDTGSYRYNPSNSLTLKVVYQQYPDIVVQEHTYSYAELLTTLASYTYPYSVQGGTRFGCINAQGFLFKDVVALEGVVLEEVYQFRFGTSDGYDNPVTYQLLYGSGQRYYFPNWDISSRAEAQAVPPMLAYRSNMVWGASEVNPSLPLDEATRFRLVYGPLWSAETNSSYQIYYIHTVTIVLAGAPPVNPDDGTGDGTGIGSGDGTGGGGGGKTGTGSGIVGTGAAGEEGGNSGEGNKPLSEGGVENDATDETGEGADGEFSDAGADSSGVDAEDIETRGWRVYEMMSRARSEVAPLDLDNPYLPLAAPFALASVAVGAGATYGGFRRRLA